MNIDLRARRDRPHRDDHRHEHRDAPAPYGCGQHPYLSPGAGRVDDCTLQLEAETRILTDPDRKLPTGAESVEGHATTSGAAGRWVTSSSTSPSPTCAGTPHGRAWVHLTGPDGATAHLWVDEAYPLVELFTGDTLDADRRRHGLGAEPMSLSPERLPDRRAGDPARAGRLVDRQPGTQLTTGGA